MKIRTSFVSNSSSTSYTCECCGASETGYDSISAEEYGFGYCVVEHELCLTCLGDKPDSPDIDTEPAAYNKWAEETEDGCFYPVESCPICMFEVIDDYSVLRYLKMRAQIRDPQRAIKKEFSSSQELQSALRKWENEG